MMISRRFKILQMALMLLAIVFMGTSAFAATKDEAAALAQDIMQATMKTQKDKTTSHYDPYNIVMDIILNRQTGDLSAQIEKLNQIDKEAVDLFREFSTLTKTSNETFTLSEDYSSLVKVSVTGNWRQKYLSNLLLAQLHLDKSDILKTLEFTGESIEIVNSQTVNTKTASMLYDSYEVLQSAYIYDRSTNQAIEAIRSLIDLAVKSERTLDGYSLVNNLAVLFSVDNRHTDAIEIMEVMEPYLDGQPEDKTILYNFTIGKFKNRAKLYDKALPHLEKIEDKASNMWLAPYVYAQLALSYANTGATTEAEKRIKKLDALPANKLPSSELFTLLRTEVKSQIAEMRGDYKKALQLKNQYSDGYIKRLNSAQFQDRKKAADRIAVSQRVATQKLENATRESALKDTIIDREKNINRITIVLLGLAAILLSVLLYGVKHQKTMNKKLAVSRDKALASEKAKSDFLAMMSHEVRTPLNSIIPVAEILRAKPQYKDDKGLLSLIVAGGNTLLQMLDNVLVVSKADNMPPEFAEDLDLIKVATPILKEYGDEAHRKGLKFSAKTTKGFPALVYSDKKIMEKVLMNLLSNAVKFTHKGDISVVFSRAAQPDFFSIKIKDTGIGIEAENIEELLEPFKQKDSGLTRSFDGLGIGLSVTNIEVKRLGGELIFHTDGEIGTTVEVMLPISTPEPLKLAA